MKNAQEHYDTVCLTNKRRKNYKDNTEGVQLKKAYQRKIGIT
jgi:hypothetical protein